MGFSTGLVPVLSRKTRGDLFVEDRDLFSNDAPDQLVIHAEVDVDEPIPHPRHGPPLDGWMLLADLGRDLLRRLSDDFKAPHKGPSQSLVPRGSLPD